MKAPTFKETKKEHTGLSYSSLSTYLACPRKYYHSKVAKTEKDPGIEDRTAFDVGSTFHLVLEDSKHNLTGLKYSTIVAACHKVVPVLGKEFAEEYAPMITAMLQSYRTMHEKSGMTVIACELELETPTFYGFVDVILMDDDGLWWIADMKTAASYSKMLPATLPRNLQLNLYAAHVKLVAEKLNLSVKDFAGVRYRLTTKSKLKRKNGEEMIPFIKRVGFGISSYDFAISREELDVRSALDIHSHGFEGTKSKDVKSYTCNFNNCVQYYRFCEYFSRCHGAPPYEA